jgi:hypothetical protein
MLDKSVNRNSRVSWPAPPQGPSILGGVRSYGDRHAIRLALEDQPCEMWHRADFSKIPALEAGFVLEFIEFDHPPRPESVAKVNSIVPRPMPRRTRLVCIAACNEDICDVAVWSRPLHENRIAGLGLRISAPGIEAFSVKDRKILIVSAIHPVSHTLRSTRRIRAGRTADLRRLGISMISPIFSSLQADLAWKGAGFGDRLTGTNRVLKRNSGSNLTSLASITLRKFLSFPYLPPPTMLLAIMRCLDLLFRQKSEFLRS